MSLGTIKSGQFGKYYEFIEEGQKKTLAMKNQGINLTEEQLDKLITDKKLDFELNGEIVHAELDSFYNESKKRNSLFIKYTGGEIKINDSDKSKVENKKDEIVQLFCDNNDYYACTKTTKLVNENSTIPLKCVNISSEVPNISKVIIFSGRKNDYDEKDKQLLVMYLKKLRTRNGYQSDRIALTDAQYLEEVNAYHEQEKERANRELLRKEYVEKGVKWLQDIKSQLFENDTTVKPYPERLICLEPIVSSVSFSDMQYLINHPPKSLRDTLKDVERYVGYKIYFDSPEDDFEKMKTSTLRWLRDYYDFHILNGYRKQLYKDINDNGLESVVENVNIDQALDLGRFKELKKLLNKKKTKPIYAIVFETYKDVVDLDTLKQYLLNMLKTYHEFFNISEKNVKALAKFIAEHNLSEYYDKMLQYDSAIETIMDSDNAALKKKLLTGIAGTSRVNLLDKSKSYYFEKHSRVQDKIIVNDPIYLLDELRKLIPEFNISSDVAILSNIELDTTGDGFTYQFYTFSKDSGGKDFDGRRLQNMTRIYNRCHKEKIYFDYD